MEQAETIRNLWHRLDDSEAERRELSAQVRGLLTHRQAGSVPAAPGTAIKQPWWRRWFR